MLMKCSGFLPLFAFITGASAGTAVQTDWSGGPGVQGPVLDLGTSFHVDTSVNWSVPGELGAGRANLRYWVDHLVHWPGNAFPVDLDGDGDMDVAGASFNDSDIFVWENVDGSGDSWTRYLVDNDFGHPDGMDWGDVDGDGDPDLFGGSYTDYDLTWWENPGSFGGVWTEHLITGSFVLCQDVDAEDIDKDGDPDLVAVAGYQNRISWWENIGGSFTEHSISSTFQPSCCIVTDLDGDGEPDVVVASEGLNEIRWYENLNSGSAWTERVLQGGVTQPSSLDAADIDGDGDTDILCGSWASDLTCWFENTGEYASSWPSHTVSNGIAYVWDVAAGDYDSDGDMDAAGSAIFATDFFWCENGDSQGMNWTDHLLAENYAGYRVAAGDFNTDGRTDIICSGYHTTQICWWDLGSLSGYIESSILNTQEEAAWDSLFWSANEPAGTGVSFQIRASENPADMGPWSDTLSTPCSLSGILQDGHQFVQYRALLVSSPNGNDPSLEEVSISWTGTGVGDSGTEPSIGPMLLPVSPNPCVFPVIRYIPAGVQTAELAVFDVCGRCVAKATGQPGEGVRQLLPGILPPGIYLCRMTSGSYCGSVRFAVVD